MKLFREDVDRSKYILANYFLASTKSLRDAAWDLAIGQSMGNPSIRNEWETDQLFEDHSCIILGNEGELDKVKRGAITIAFPIANLDWEEDGFSQLLCHLMGGQMDIYHITECQLNDISFPQSMSSHFSWGRPRISMDDIRRVTSCWDKPLLGAIVKPKVIDTEDTLAKIATQLFEGGVNFIKEDEIMASPKCLPLRSRIKVIEQIRPKNVFYAYCINADPHKIFDKAQAVVDGGGNAFHVNFWSGLGIYNSLRLKFPNTLIHFQKSGDKILTGSSHKYHIYWPLLCKLVGIMGVSTAHAGMINGYSGEDPAVIGAAITVLQQHRVVPALSCGMHPGLVDNITKQIGCDYMANVGGAIHGHPGGTKAGALAMRQAIDKTGGPEYDAAIAKWGKV